MQLTMQFEISLLLLRALSIDTLGSPWPVRILRSENRMVGKSLSKKLMLSILGLVWAGSSMFTSKLRMRSIVIDYTKCHIILRCPQCKPQITEPSNVLREWASRGTTFTQRIVYSWWRQLKPSNTAQFQNPMNSQQLRSVQYDAVPIH